MKASQSFLVHGLSSAHKKSHPRVALPPITRPTGRLGTASVSMEEVQRVASVIHEVNALTGHVDQSKQSACTRWIPCVVEQGREDLDALPSRFHEEPVVAIHSQNVPTDCQSHAQWIIQAAAAGDCGPGIVAGLTSKRIGDGRNPIAQTVSHIEHLVVFAERYSGRPYHQGGRICSFWKS